MTHQGPAAEEVFRYTMSKKGVDAKAIFKNPTMVVKKGSTAAANDVPAMYEGHRKLRDQLIASGIIVFDKDSGDFVFTQDYEFSTPTEAVCVVEGGSRSGCQSWKKDGKTLRDLGLWRD